MSYESTMSLFQETTLIGMEILIDAWLLTLEIYGRIDFPQSGPGIF